MAWFPAAATGENGEILTIAWDPSFMKTIQGRLKLGAIVRIICRERYRVSHIITHP